MKMPNQSPPSLCQFELPEHDQKWLESHNFSHATTEDRHGAVKFLTEELKMPYRNGAVFKAYNSGEIPTALVSGRACASRYDIARWAMLRKYRHSSQKDAKA
jgi:hypothetical protein